MNTLFVVIFIIFFVLPWFDKAKKKKGGNDHRSPETSSPWGQTHEQIKTNKYGHSDAKNKAHKRLHSRDASSAFPKEHQQRVRQRDLRDRLENHKMEETIHSRENAGIIRAKNKGRSDWGARGDKTSFVGLFILLIFGAVFYFIASVVVPTYF